MARKRTGSVYQRPDGRWVVQVTGLDGKRYSAVQAEGTSEARARETAAAFCEQLAAGRFVRADQPAGERETLAAYVPRWLATRRDPKEPRTHFREWIVPVLGADTPLVELVRDDVERVVRHLDEVVRLGRIRWKTAVSIWGSLTKLLDDACNHKQLNLRVLKVNPADKVRGPDRGDDRQSTYLFPREAAALLSSEAVPVRWRTAYALALYTGLRLGELSVLRVQDVVLEGGYVTVHKAHDRVTKGEKSTKGRRARRVPIEPSLRPLLVALTEGRPGDELLADLPPKQKVADELREHLRRVGLTRAELYANDDQRRPLTFHDLRHTYATWLALRGDDELKIQARLGHATTDMTQRYIAEAEALGHGDLGAPFGPLPSFQTPKAIAAQNAASLDPEGPKLALSLRFLQRGGRDSNPRPPA